MSDPTPRRVRVTAADAQPRRAGGILGGARDLGGRGLAVRDLGVRGLGQPGSPSDDPDAVYSRALRRTQLRLALGTVIGFVVVALALTIALAGIPELDRIALWGVPLSWLIHALAFYPVIVVFAVLYARAAARNEQRYRSLQELE